MIIKIIIIDIFLLSFFISIYFFSGDSALKLASAATATNSKFLPKAFNKWVRDENGKPEKKKEKIIVVEDITFDYLSLIILLVDYFL